MPYKYSFDDTYAGDLRLSKDSYKILHQSYQLICSKIAEWDRKAMEHGATHPPYKEEQADFDNMIEWGEHELKAKTRPYEPIVVDGISVGSLRYSKAALLFMINEKQKEIQEKEKQGWPSGALQSLKENLVNIQKIEQSIKHPPADILWELIPKDSQENTHLDIKEWDVFISHAYEDKEDFARPLAEKLRELGLKIWFDEFTLKIGDSLRRSIDKGLSGSKYGVVIISPHFLSKEWPQKELDGLVGLEAKGRKMILPVWHKIDSEEIRKYSPMLADRYAVSSHIGVEEVVDALLSAMDL